MKTCCVKYDSFIGVSFTYGYDAQRMRMTVTDTLTGRTKTKDYVGNCEFINDNGAKRTYTYLTCPYGVFAIVISSGNNHSVHYVYKDHLGSWTTITDSIGTVVERKSFDAWGNLRDPSTWSGSPSRPPKFDRGFTGHEHLYSFGLINMNGRMYDPLLSSFLSPDNYMQDPTSQQGFNRYAYCMYNPLKYVDPSGERQMGWIYSTYQWEQEARAAVTKEWEKVYEVCTLSHNLTHSMACSIYSIGSDACGGGGSSGNHGSGGGDGGNSGGQTGNGHGGKDNTQNNSSKSILDGLPGSSKDNPASAKDLAEKIYWWYMFGNRQNFYVDASTIDFSYLSYGDLKDKGNGTYSINLFSDPYLNIDPDMASILGEFSLTSKGNNFYQIDNDTYDFDIHFNKGFSKRNIITVLGGFILYGNINNRHYIPTPAMFFGGPFQIHFVNCVYIKP